MKLTIIKNPFDYNTRVTKEITPDKPIFDLVKPFIPNCKYEVILDDRVIPFEESKAIVPKNDQTLAVRAVVSGSSSSNKNVLSAVASLALAITTLGVGSMLAGGAFIGAGMITTGWGLTSWAGALAVTFIGGYLINLWFSDDEEDETTYDWGSVEANDREGGAVQMTYGTIKVGANGQAQILSQYITYDGSYQYLNVLLCGGEGPCDYTGDGEDDNCTGITNIKINDNAIANYDDITVYKRAGLNNQTKVPNFDDSYDVKSLSYELDYESGVESEWKTDQTYGIGAGLEFVISFAAGLYHTNSKGNLETTSVNLQIQYKLITSETWLSIDGLRTDSASKNNDYEIYMSTDYTSIYLASTVINMVASSGTTSTTISSSVLYGDSESGYYTIITVPMVVPSGLTSIQKSIDYHTISGCQNEPLYWVKLLDNVTEGQYDVRARCTYKSGTSTSYSNAVYWISIATITYDDFIRPNKILLAIQALATDQLSGTLNVTWEQTRSYVYVWVPDSEADPWGSGSYIQKLATNPAWAAYDILHGCYKIYNINTSAFEYVIKRISADKFLYADFKKWADFCDEYEITCAYFVNDTQTLWDSLSPLETIGRGKVCQFGTKIGVMANFPGEIVQKFNYSNIIAESFQGEFVGQSERANALEVSFLDADREYKKRYFPAYGTDYNEAETVNPTSIFLQACSSLDVAWRHAQFQLRLNKYLYRSAKWQCDVDSISSRLGDVVAVSTPKWGVGGRIVSVGDSWIEVEKTIDAFGEVINGVEITPGVTYIVKITLSDDTIMTKTVQQWVSCAIFGRAGYTLGSENGSVTGTRIYFTEAFTNDRAMATYVGSTSFTVEGDLTANFVAGNTELILYAGYGDMYQTTITSSSYNGTLTTVICANVPEDIYEARWGFTKPEQYNLYSFGTDGTGYKLFRLTHIERHDDLTATLSGLEYIAEVYTDNTTVPTIESGADTGTVTVSVTEHTDQGGDLYLDIGWLPSRKIYYGALIYINDIQIAKTEMSVNAYSYKVAAIGEYTVKIVALDYFGNPYANASKTYTLVGEVAPGNVTALTDYLDDGVLYLSWNLISDSRSILYEIRKGATWATATVLGRTSDNKYAVSGDGTYWVAAYYRTLYSATPISLEIEGTSAIRNVLAFWDEAATDWSGTHTNTQNLNGELWLTALGMFDDIPDFDAVTDLDTYGGVASSATYQIPTSHIITLEKTSSCPIYYTLDSTGGTVISQVKVATVSGTFGDWQTLTNGQNYVGLEFDFRLSIASTGEIVKVTAFTFTIDVPDAVDKGTNVLIPLDGLSISFNRTFHDAPGISCAILNGSAGEYYEATTPTKTGFTIRLYDANGTSISKYISWTAIGY